METKKLELELPAIMLEAIDNIVDDKTLGFADRDEFVREALRGMITNYG